MCHEKIPKSGSCLFKFSGSFLYKSQLNELKFLYAIESCPLPETVTAG
jgi:hypothetical protein